MKDSHTNFLTKCIHPLWKNLDFFKNLTFKRNKDIDHIKVNHIGMNPKHLQLATKELNQLQAEDFIEPTTSQWTCPTLYVNKRSKEVCEKMRFVIDYKPLNHFFADDKFSLPNKKTLFASLSEARIFSKFDLKARIWQLGIKIEGRHKTRFCIPNHH